MPSLFSSSSSNTTNQNGSSTVATSGSSSSTPTFSAGLQQLMNSLQGYSTQSMTNPSAQLAPIQSAGLDQINQQYATAPDVVSSQLASRGYGSSGLMGNSLVKIANAKAGAQSQFNGQLAGDAVQQSQFGANLANSLLNTGKGTSGTTSGTSTGTSSSDSNSNSTSTPSIMSDIGSVAGLASMFMGLPSFGGGGLTGSGSGAGLNPTYGNTGNEGLSFP